MIRLPKSFVRSSMVETSYHAQLIQNKYYEMKPLLQQQRMAGNVYEERVITSYAKEFSIAMHKNKMSLYTFEVFIQNKKYQFLIDTGAQISGVMKSKLKHIKSNLLDVHTQIGSVGGKSKQADIVEIDRFFLGALKVEHQPFVVLDDDDFKLPYIHKMMMKFDGIIGWDILSTLDFEMDDIKKEFKVLACTKEFKYQNIIPTSFPVFLLENEKRNAVTFGFDSGAHDTWLGKDYVNENKLHVVGRKQGIGMGVLGFETLEIDIVKKNTLRLHHHVVELKNTRTGRVDMFPNHMIAGVLGNRIIKGKRIQIFNSKQFIRIL